MAKKAAKAKTSSGTADEAGGVPAAPVPRPRLHKLRVSNFRCIGSTPVEIELDDILVLVGPNNAGKSSILRAYEVVMLQGSSLGNLTADDFPDGKCAPDRCPTIELETVVFEKTAPGDKWVRTDTATGEMFVREKWTWQSAGEPAKVGWDVASDDWAASGGPWGAANVANARRPMPHRVGAFDSPEKQAEQVAKLLKEALKECLKNLKAPKTSESGDSSESEYDTLLGTVRKLRADLATDALKAVDEVRSSIEAIISKVFKDYKVTLDARPDDDIDAAVDLIAGTPVVRMGPKHGFQAPMANQGSGARRTLLWAALRILAERGGAKSLTASERPHLLLMDEPELCLHPDAVREACRVLYDLPQTKNWQVMITTHSPVFIDLSRDNTSIVRVERDSSDIVQGTTLFRPKRAKLDPDDKAELKLLNMCDPYVAEFFFGGRTIVVEGDTEYTAFRYVVATDQEKYRGVHVVRSRGKACVKALCKILNQFEKRYAVLHDSDREKIKFKKKPGEMTNPMWTENQSILDVTTHARATGKVFLAASIPNFEEAFFGKEAEGEKPYAAWVQLRSESSTLSTVSALLDALMDPEKALPAGAIQWSSMGDLESAVAAFDKA